MSQPEKDIAESFLIKIQSNLSFDRRRNENLQNNNSLISDDLLFSVYCRSDYNSELTFEDFKEKVRRENSQKEDECPSSYEDPHDYYHLKQLVQEIISTKQHLFSSIPDNFIFGTLPTGRVNGLAVAIPNSKYRLILIESGLFGFSSVISKIIAFSFPSLKNNEFSFSTELPSIIEYIDENPKIVDYFRELLIAYLIKGDPNLIDQFSFLSNERYYIMSPILNSFELFVVGHELGHIIDGQLDRNQLNSISIGGNNLEEIKKNWADEYIADSIGMSLMLSCMEERGFDPAMSICGADLFFGSIDIVTKGLDILKFGNVQNNSGSNTHPPILLRRKALRDVIIESITKAQENEVLGLSYIIEQIIDKLWSCVESDIKKLFLNGVKANSIWQDDNY